MSKKNKKKKEVERNKDGFAILKPTGKLRLQFISNDDEEIDDILSKKKSLIMDGEYLKALPSKDEKEIISTFIDNFCKDKNPKKDSIKNAKKILQIAKTIYEFGAEDSALAPKFISDSLYDKLISAYNKLEDEPESFIPKSGKGKEKIKTEYNTLSNNLDKAYIVYAEDEIPSGVKEKQSVEKFLEDAIDELDIDPKDELEIELSPKIDGVSCNASVIDGVLKDPSSRGDKEVGMYLKSLDGFMVNKNEEHDKFGIQYEIFVDNENREKLAKIVGIPKNYATNRSAASASINRLANSGEKDLAKHLYFYPIASEGLDMSYKDSIKYIQKFGIVPDGMIKREYIEGTKKQLLKKIKAFYEKCLEQRDDLEYSIDGVVITFVKDKYQDKLGRSGSTNNYQLALKFPPNSAIGIAKRYYFSSGDLGTRTAMLKLEQPVYVNGTKYQDIPVLSIDTLESLDLHKGDEVKVKQTGDAIPTVIVDEDCKRNKSGEKLEMDLYCLTCHKPVVIKDGRYKCVNPNCQDNKIGRISHFMKKIGIEGFDYATAQDVYNKLGIKDVTKLSELTAKDLNTIGYDKKATDFVKGIKESYARLSDYELLGALGLEGIQGETAKKILSAVSINELKPATYHKLAMKLKEIKGIKDSAHDLANQLLDNLDLVKKMFEIVNPAKTDFESAKTVGATGVEFSKKIKNLIKSKGWMMTEGKKFDILITTSHNRTSDKMRRAKDNNLEIYTEQEFIKKFDSENE